MSLSAVFRQQTKAIAFGLNTARLTPSTAFRQFSTSLLRQQQSWGQRGDSEYSPREFSSRPRRDGNEFGGGQREYTPRRRNNDDFGGRTTFRKPNAPSSIIFVGNLPFSVEEAEIREALEEFGAITELRMATHPDGRFRGYAHVEFANQADAVRLYEAAKDEPVMILDRPARLDYGAPKKSSSRDSEPYHILHVYNFRGGVTDLVDAFRAYGVSSKSINFMKDRDTGEPMDKFWIDMQSIEKATEALNQLNDTETESGHQLRVAFARPRPASNHGNEWGGGQKTSGYQSRSSYGLRQQRSDY